MLSLTNAGGIEKSTISDRTKYRFNPIERTSNTETKVESDKFKENFTEIFSEVQEREEKNDKTQVCGVSDTSKQLLQNETIYSEYPVISEKPKLSDYPVISEKPKLSEKPTVHEEPKIPMTSHLAKNKVLDEIREKFRLKKSDLTISQLTQKLKDIAPLARAFREISLEQYIYYCGTFDKITANKLICRSKELNIKISELIYCITHIFNKRYDDVVDKELLSIYYYCTSYKVSLTTYTDLHKIFKNREYTEIIIHYGYKYSIEPKKLYHLIIENI